MPKEYIERENAVELIKNYAKGAISDGIKALDPVDDIIAIVKGFDLIPAADVVPVVRCKDCKWCEDMFMSGLYCKHPDGRNTIHCRPNDYCNDGEKKEENKK